MPRARLLSVLVIAAVATIFIVLPLFARLYTDWLWFAEVQLQPVFLRTFSAIGALGATAFVAALVVLLPNLRLAQGTLKARAFTVVGAQGPHTISLDLRRMRPLFDLGAVGASVLIALYASGKWDLWLMARHAVPFGTSDPILGRDVCFYVFQLPFLQFLQGIVFMTVAAGRTRRGPPFRRPEPGARSAARSGDQRHGAPPSELAGRRHFRATGLQRMARHPGTADFTRRHGARRFYVDIHARMPVQWVLVVAACVGAILALYQRAQRRFWPILPAAGLYAGVAIAGGLYGTILQRFFVAPNEQVRETPYIAHRSPPPAPASRSTASSSGSSPAKRAHRRRTSSATPRRSTTCRCGTRQPLLDTFGQIQEIRTYYDFVSVDNDRYVIDGEYRQIMLSARELNSASLPSRTWINERLTFTHGYGLTLGPVNEVTREGLPVLFIKDLPLESTVDLRSPSRGSTTASCRTTTCS